MIALNAERRLANRTVFLSGSVPEPHRGFIRVQDAAFVVEQAVLALARAVLAEGGRIVFGAHPSISPLVAAVAAEYRQASAASEPKPVIIYQSRAFEELLPNETWDMHRFGFADLIWTDAKGDEKFQRGNAASLKCPLSLTEMRTRMIAEQKPVAMVIAGGMDGVREELALFRKYAPESPVYAARDTGGFALLLAANLTSEPQAPALEPRQIQPLSIVEDDWVLEGGNLSMKDESYDPRDSPLAPYGAIMRWLIKRLAANLPPSTEEPPAS
jgi:hypothetical protein